MILKQNTINRFRTISLLSIGISIILLALFLLIYSKKILPEEYILVASFICFFIGGILGTTFSLIYTYKSIFNKDILNIIISILLTFISSTMLYATAVLFAIF